MTTKEKQGFGLYFLLAFGLAWLCQVGGCMALLQKAHGIWVDCAGRVRACGTGVDFVWSKRVGQGLRHLAATGVVRADKGDAKRCESAHWSSRRVRDSRPLYRYLSI